MWQQLDLNLELLTPNQSSSHGTRHDPSYPNKGQQKCKLFNVLRLKIFVKEKMGSAPQIVRRGSDLAL